MRSRESPKPRPVIALALTLAVLALASCGRFVIVASPNPTYPSPSTVSDQLNQVSCPTPSFCVAVGGHRIRSRGFPESGFESLRESEQPLRSLMRVNDLLHGSRHLR
jgi:hypothetical protein